MVLLLGGAGFYFGYPAYMAPQLKTSSKAYVDESIKAIVSGWSQDALTSRCTPDLNEAISGAKVTTLFDHLLELGSLKSYDGSKGQTDARFSLHSGLVASASYTADVTCEYGKVEFGLDLTQVHGKWFIDSIKITPLPSQEVSVK